MLPCVQVVSFSLSRALAPGLDDLVARLKVLKPNLIVLEATGGFETVAVAALAGLACRSQSPIPHRSGPSPKPSASAPRRTRSMPA
jgi:hypothetical protein